MSKSLDTLWGDAFNLLKGEMTEISLNTWVKPIKPLEIRDNTILFEVQLEFTKNMLERRYYDLIKNAFLSACGKEFDIEFLLPSDIQTQETPPGTEVFHKPSPQLASLNPDYVFDNFVVGNSNQFAHAAFPLA